MREERRGGADDDGSGGDEMLTGEGKGIGHGHDIKAAAASEWVELSTSLSRWSFGWRKECTDILPRN